MSCKFNIFPLFCCVFFYTLSIHIANTDIYFSLLLLLLSLSAAAIQVVRFCGAQGPIASEGTAGSKNVY